jgi:hypothetical protein
VPVSSSSELHLTRAHPLSFFVALSRRHPLSSTPAQQQVDKLREQLHKAQRENQERETALLLHNASADRLPSLFVEEVGSRG